MQNILKCPFLLGIKKAVPKDGYKHRVYLPGGNRHSDVIACEDVHRRCFATTNVSQDEDQSYIDKFLHFSAPVRELRGIKSG
ncbi:hypothetical protein ETA_32660 [Erwinia tasmaniensis Et1/99]|uniref:Uncharacterized protein n=1 Tax=Erwinia tasmaniensis (strain DSM 17950 / CFBP 7177 / CIP 109463 / NCPPB 4357 / Et1/99) TaxID=465817 RepID=B2VJQ5_ERWT9|nr:hypothetical protein ETA_32660 [Erwinia tasmaniensis Et1/99]